MQGGEAATMIRLTEDDNGHEVTLAVGESMELSLGENRTTGYKWEFSGKAGPVCELQKDDFEAAAKAPGGGGVHRWQFLAVKPGSVEITLQYRRPWEQDAAAARTFRVKVQVAHS